MTIEAFIATLQPFSIQFRIEQGDLRWHSREAVPLRAVVEIQKRKLELLEWLLENGEIAA